jgi:hypothetical protein
VMWSNSLLKMGRFSHNSPILFRKQDSCNRVSVDSIALGTLLYRIKPDCIPAPNPATYRRSFEGPVTLSLSRLKQRKHTAIPVGSQLPGKIVNYPLYTSAARWQGIKRRLPRTFFIFEPRE